TPASTTRCSRSDDWRREHHKKGSEGPRVQGSEREGSEGSRVQGSEQEGLRVASDGFSTTIMLGPSDPWTLGPFRRNNAPTTQRQLQDPLAPERRRPHRRLLQPGDACEGTGGAG